MADDSRLLEKSSRLPEGVADDAHDARCCLWDCRKVRLVMLIAAQLRKTTGFPGARLSSKRERFQFAICIVLQAMRSKGWAYGFKDS